MRLWDDHIQDCCCRCRGEERRGGHMAFITTVHTLKLFTAWVFLSAHYCLVQSHRFSHMDFHPSHTGMQCACHYTPAGKEVKVLGTHALLWE